LSPWARPKGQRAIEDFPRFGLQQFQYRFPDQIERVAFEVGGGVEKPLLVEERFFQLPRTKQVSDFHCVTTWTPPGFRLASAHLGMGAQSSHVEGPF
jgi:DMSO/TMAO reductase YedYZ molybdopterin-dependent catalytic subunit